MEDLFSRISRDELIDQIEQITPDTPAFNAAPPKPQPTMEPPQEHRRADDREPALPFGR